jgi:hypothetical protein
MDPVDAVEQADVTSRVGDLVGRESETRALEALVSHAPTHGAALVLRGPAGVGKSALLSVACDAAAHRGMHVWRVSGVKAEMCVPLAGLHQILWPMLERAHDLDRPYREILLPSFGVGYGPTSGSFMIAVATLELLSVVAAEAPLLVVVDDAHWLDRETWEVLGFVARRLASHSVVVVMAAREGYPGDLVRTLGIPEFKVMPLDERSSAAILAAKSPDLDPECRARVLAEAAGNPMALVELSTLDQCAASTFGRPDRLSMTTRLQSALVDRFLYLPPATQALLVVASIDDRATVYEIVRAATVVGDGCHPTVDDLTPALESGLVEPDNTRIHFCHPLTAAAIYDTCSAGTRRRAHEALAGTLAAHEYRRSWHKAAAAIPPDEVAGNALEMAVMNSGSQTRPNLLPAALERAALLSSEVGVRQKRLLRAVELALDLGERSRAEQLLSEVRPHECGPVEYARLGLVRDMVVAGLVRDPSAVEGLIEASLEAGATGDSAVAWRLLRAAAVRSWWADLGAEMRCRIASAAGQLSATDDNPAKLSVLATVDPGRCIEALAPHVTKACSALRTRDRVFARDRSAFLWGI